jgi:AP-1 complex subunit beta-1
MSGSDSKYFNTTKRGEMHELKEELNVPNKDKQKDAVKKVIAAMTVGKDVSVLIADMIKCMQTPNIELKKLVYLYLINYAHTQPDLAILAVNTFVKVRGGAGGGRVRWGTGRALANGGNRGRGMQPRLRRWR